VVLLETPPSPPTSPGPERPLKRPPQNNPGRYITEATPSSPQRTPFFSVSIDRRREIDMLL
jgi:hypothetical protein